MWRCRSRLHWRGRHWSSTSAAVQWDYRRAIAVHRGRWRRRFVVPSRDWFGIGIVVVALPIRTSITPVSRRELLMLIVQIRDWLRIVRLQLEPIIVVGCRVHRLRHDRRRVRMLQGHVSMRMSRVCRLWPRCGKALCRLLIASRTVAGWELRQKVRLLWFIVRFVVVCRLLIVVVTIMLTWWRLLHRNHRRAIVGVLRRRGLEFSLLLRKRSCLWRHRVRSRRHPKISGSMLRPARHRRALYGIRCGIAGARSAR